MEQANRTTRKNIEHEQTLDKQTLQSWRSSWRHGSTWLYLVMLIASAAALFISFALSAETLEMAKDPGIHLSCDVNATVSCSTVAASWQSNFIHLLGVGVPNAFFGIAAESVFVTVAVIGLARIKVPRWFAIATWWGGLAALCYSYWLLSQSLFVIDALCPWCLGLMFATTIQFLSLTHATVTVQNEPLQEGRLKGLRTFLDGVYRPNIDLMIDVLWLAIIIAIILIRDGSRMF